MLNDISICMLTLDNIKEKVYFEYRRAQMEAMKTERLGVIHVSDVIKPCMRNVVYNKITPHTMSTEDMKSLYFGQIVHSNSMIAKPENNEMFLTYNYVKDEPLTREEALKKIGLTSDKKLLLLIPASRKQELKYILPTLLQAAKLLQEKDPSITVFIPSGLKEFDEILNNKV